MMVRPGSMENVGARQALHRRRDLAPARGIAHGVILGVLLWLFIFVLWFA